MSQFFHLNIDESLLVEQLSQVGGMVGILRSGNTVTIDPTDIFSIGLLEGLEELLSEMAEQSDAPLHPDRPDPFKMDRDELADFYLQETGDSLDDAFGCGCCWDTEDGQAFVADYLDSLND